MAFAESPETSMEESFGYITGGFESIQSRKIEGVRVLIAYVENLAALVSLYNSNFANTALRSGQKQNKFCKIFRKNQIPNGPSPIDDHEVDNVYPRTAMIIRLIF